MKKLIFALIVLGAAGVAAGWYVLQGDTVAEVVHPVRGPAVRAVYATGTVEPSVMIPVAPRVGARLTGLAVDEGHTVTAGQILAQLEDSDRTSTLDELRSRAELAQREYERKSQMLKKGVISQSALDTAKSDRDASGSALKRAEAEAGFLKLIAPENGLVIRRDGEVGEMISVGQPVFWLSCCKPLRVAVEVDEEDVALVRPGQDVLIAADAYPGKSFTGKIESITPKGDPVARSYRVRIGLEDKTPLMIGMTAEANITVSHNENALLVPATAVQNNKIWVVKDGVLQSHAVETGARTESAAEIVQGLDGENVLVVRQPKLDWNTGDTVRSRTINWSPHGKP